MNRYNKIIKISIVGIGVLICGIFSMKSNMQVVSASECLDHHASWCDAISPEDKLYVAFEKIKKFAKKYHHALPHMIYRAEGAYIGCANVNKMIFFPGEKKPCVPNWTAWSACDATCGPGNQTRNDGCGKSWSRSCNKGACPSAPAPTPTPAPAPAPTPTPAPAPAPTACSPFWGGWSACSVTCGGGTRIRVQNCTGITKSQPCNTQPCCGSADKESYERTSEVEAAERCTVGDTVNNWVDNSGLAAAGGIAWTWNCSDGTADSNQCLAYKEGKCGYDDATSPSNPPYDTKDEACRFGSFNSVKLIGGILHWKCGTGDTSKTVGDFFSNNPTNGDTVFVDYYGPKAGGVDCQCTPVYEYECKETGVYIGSCDNNCGGTIEETVQAVKTDTTCFLNTSMFISNTEYNTATGKNCTSKTINCAPCGVQDADGGSYHESN